MAYSMYDIIKMGRNLQGQQLNKSLLASQGKLNPWDMPEWGPIVQGMRSQGDQGLNQLTKSLLQSGVTGPSAALTLERGEQGNLNNILGLANQMQAGMANQEQQGVDMFQQIQNMIANYALGKSGQHNQRDIAKAQGISSGAQSGMGMLCCFIMNEGEGMITDEVRTVRDYYVQNYKDGPLVSIGYKKMASKLVPVMKRFRFVKETVKWSMTRPITKFCQWCLGISKGGWVFYPITAFWLGVWYYIGRK